MASQRLLDSPPAARPRSRRLSTKSMVTTLLGLLFVGLWAFPFLYMLLSTFKTPIDNISMPPKFVFEPTTDNYATVFGNPDVLRFLRSSLIVASLSTAVALLLAFPAAYGLVRFRRFYRTEKSRSQAHGGLGLGLSIVKSLVKTQGGDIRAEAARPRGFAVVITLPPAPADLAE